MGNGEATYWAAYYGIEPFGELREDIRHAQLLCLLANTNRDSEKRPEPFTLDDFLPNYWQDAGERDEEMRKQTMLQKFQMFAAQINKQNVNRDTSD